MLFRREDSSSGLLLDEGTGFAKRRLVVGEEGASGGDRGEVGHRGRCAVGPTDPSGEGGRGFTANTRGEAPAEPRGGEGLAEDTKNEGRIPSGIQGEGVVTVVGAAAVDEAGKINPSDEEDDGEDVVAQDDGDVFH